MFSKWPFQNSATECCQDKRYPKKVLKKAGASILQLNPQLKEGLLRVGGRLVSGPFGDKRKHPMGSVVRRVLGRCMTCQWQRKACPGKQFMADLPEARLVPEKPPFTYVGVDYIGPLEVKQGRSRVKRHGGLFTCLTTCAVHMEIAHSLDNHSMISALRIFISICGYPEQIRSNQGSNFTKADKEVKEAIEEWKYHKINNFCRQKKIEWIFNPPCPDLPPGIFDKDDFSCRSAWRQVQYLANLFWLRWTRE